MDVIISSFISDLDIMNFPYSSFTEELKEAFPKGQKVICGIIDAKTDQISKDKKGEKEEWLQLI